MWSEHVNYLDHSCYVANNHLDILLFGVVLKHSGVCDERYQVVVASNAEHVNSCG
jgi:hypothetical protein